MRRAAILIAGVALLVALAAPSKSPAAGDPGLTYICSPPVPPTQSTCGGWHNAPITIVWVWDKNVADGNCPNQVLSKDSNGSAPLASCTVEAYDHSTTETVRAFVKIDRTPPTIVSAIPNRAPDSGSWFNHAVGFTFSGTDATSGVASCDTVTFAGPGAQVAGGCHDVAGNYGTGAFPVNYDNTPPILERAKAAAGNASTTLTWTASPDTVTTQIMRTPGKRGRRSTVVYAGNGRRFHDRDLTNGRLYRYTVTAFDQAGNPTSKRVAARPRVSLGLKPARGVRLKHAPRLRWPAVGGATYYNVQLFRGSVKEFSAWPSHAHLKLHRRWTFLGRHFRLAPGRYRWYVWPGYGSRAAHRFGSFIGQSTFVILR